MGALSNIEITTLVLFVFGFVLLIGGGEILVRGASRLAVSMGISPLVVGLTVVAFCTSAPELAVSIQAAVAGQGDLAVGNVIGSNISNILLILGIAALIAPVVIKQQLIIVDVPLMIIASLLMWVFALDGVVSPLEGALLFIGILGYILFAMAQSRREQRSVKAQYSDTYAPPARSSTPLWVSLSQVIIGVSLLVIGANWLVDGAVAVAKALGVGELIIGLTVIAVGTSLPELATSVIASARGERDIAAGNVIGSCIFNILGVLGATALLAPNGVAVPATAISFDLPIMVATAVACLPIFFSGNRISRGKGALFVGYYLAYVAYVVLAAIQHPALNILSTVALWFAIPLTIITLLTLFFRQLRANRLARAAPENAT